MRFNLVVFWVILLSFSSCSREEKTVYDFPLEQSLKSDKEVSLNKELLAPYLMCSYDSTLCLIDWTANPMVHVYNMNTGKEMVAFGNKGMGPDDFLSISQMYVDMGKRSLVLYDQSLQTISSFQIDSLAQGSLSKIDCVSAPKLGMNRVYAYSDSIFYGSGTFESGLIAKCNQKEILNQYLPFPHTEQAVNRDVNYLLFQGDLIMKPDKKRFAYLAYECDLLSIQKVVNDTCLESVVHLNTYTPVFENQSTNEVSSVNVSTDSPKGFLRGVATENYVYALYSGQIGKNKAIANEVYVFEWEGRAVKKVILDRWGICISVDSNDERLCLMTKETDGGEERYHYYCYQLN